MESGFEQTSRRRFVGLSMGSLAALGSGVQARSNKSVWEVVELNGLEYVTASSLVKFYGFDSFTRDDKDLLFRTATTAMKWKIGSPSIYINNIKFSLSYPVIERNKDALVSRIDLQKLLDPVLRPWYIKDTQQFHTVTIDAGHGGHDPGARGKHGDEKDFALDLAKRLSAAVKERGLSVHMTRDDDTFLTLGQRVQIANRVNKSIFVSIHFNAGKSDASGIETYALAPQGTSSTNGGSIVGSSYTGNQRDAENIALATAVHAMVMSRMDSVDRGIKRARFNVLRGINRPAILFEGGFVTNWNESKRVASAAYRDELATAIAGGIVNFRNAIRAAR